MGLELAEDLGVIMIARAKGRHFLVYHGADRIEFDSIPERRPTPAVQPKPATSALSSASQAPSPETPLQV